MNGKTFFVGGVVLVVVVAVAAGLLTAGSPEAERMRRADQQRMSDLQQISYAVDAVWNHDHAFPQSLQELAKSPNTYIQSIRDPRTNEEYELHLKEGNAYELCAVFETPSGSGPDQPPRVPPTETFWSHGVGRTCFALEVTEQPSVDLMMAPKRVPPVQQ